MSVLGVLLLALGTADAVRSRAWGDAGRTRLVTCLAGLAVLVVVAVLAGLWTGADLALLAVAAAVLVAWVSTSAEDTVRDRGAARPLAVLGGGAALLIAFSGWSSPAGGALERWLRWSAVPVVPGLDGDRALLLAGLLLVQLATGNIIVRLVLIGVGALKQHGTPQASDRLRGGRLLGPMERVIILGLGLAGEVTAASLVIAAKGLIRWPELQHSRTGEEGTRVISTPAPGVDEVTEYFLVGSMVSWLVSLTALAVALLA